MLNRLFFYLLLIVAAVTASAHDDPRHILNGHIIPSVSYADQPYVIITPDNTWLCVLTTGSGKEGGGGQHIISTISTDFGKSWSEPVEIEPPSGPAASWAMPLLTPFGRVYVFYDYNGDEVLKDKRHDMLGWYCYKYSDDYGLTWSEKRYRLPVRVTNIDRNNELKDPDFPGKLIQMFWGIGKPIIVNHKDGHGQYAILGFSKIGRYLIEKSEGWFFCSDNILTERDPEKIVWNMLPKGENPLSAPEHGDIQEEQNLVSLANGDLFCMYRTTMGYPVCSYSRDEGLTWSKPERATYTPEGRPIKHPRACPRVWRCKNGKYLFWFHNHGGRSYDDRNPAWILGGVEKDGFIRWSQPEILLYDPDPKVRMSYPDLIEQDGKYWVTETQKEIARVHEIDKTIFNDLWAQIEGKTPKKYVKKGLKLEWSPGKKLKMPVLPGLDKEGAFTLELVVKMKDLSPGHILFDSRAKSGKGLLIKTAKSETSDGSLETVQIDMCDGHLSARWDVDPGLLSADKIYHIAFICDSGPNIISVVANGQVLDGGYFRQWGFGRFHPKLGDVNGASYAELSEHVFSLRIYDRYLRTAEVIQNYQTVTKHKKSESPGF